MTSTAIDVEAKNPISSPRRAAFFLFALATGFLFAAPSIAQAQTYSVIYTFCSAANCVDGIEPSVNLIVDKQGNLYGEAQEGGSFSGYCANELGCGTVFELTPTGAESVFDTFGSFAGGYTPVGGLARDANGNLYGNTTFGGSSNKVCNLDGGCGVVFEVTPEGTSSVLYTFTGGRDGFWPNGNPILDTQGNLYGTTFYGGHARLAGTVFKITPTGQKITLYEFGAYKGDARSPQAGLIMDAQGNLYGTTRSGGLRGSEIKGLTCPGGCGTVFQINPAGVETILYTFMGWKAQDGAAPGAGLVMDGQGNLYGTTVYGGVYGDGSVFKLTLSGKETVLYSFTGGADGSFPLGSLALDAQGNIYGTTWRGGAHDFGVVFELPTSGTETILYSFTGGTDGSEPAGSLVFDKQGNLYGSTPWGGNTGGPCSEGGRSGCGVIFKLTP